MSGFQVLLVAGTHGNEINAPWLMDHWLNNPHIIKASDIKTFAVEGNPCALKVGRRYLDRDLNRSFCDELLRDLSLQDYEVGRARKLLSLYGPQGAKPCQIVLDFHSTTSSMGSSLVVYGRRPSDLALASLIQARLGIPIYLHEADQDQYGFLVEKWPCGLVIEIGPVPQSFLAARIIEKNQLILEVCLEEISKIISRKVKFPQHLVIHRHLSSIDFPRDQTGKIQAFVHPELQGNDWQPIDKGTPLFEQPNGDVVRYNGQSGLIPVFINEAAYAEKNIAMSLTKKETWILKTHWKNSLKDLTDY